MEDKEIILRCLSGEIEIFEMLVIKYQADVLSMTWSVLGDKEEAKDVTQEAFIQTYLNLNRFDSTKSFRNWLYAIAYKRCLDRKRKERSLSRFIQKAIKEKNPNTEVESEEKRLECSETFGPILNKLNEKERTAIYLKMSNGYTAKEISEIFNCAESTVRVYLLNAKRKLKKLLKEKKHVSTF